MGKERTQDDLFAELGAIKEKIDKIHNDRSFKKCPVCKAYIDVNESTVCPCGKATYSITDKKWTLKDKEEKETNADEEKGQKKEDNTISGFF